MYCNQWRNSALIIGGGGGTKFRRGADNFGGIQATISHPSKFWGGPSPLSPPGIAPMIAITDLYITILSYVLQ